MRDVIFADRDGAARQRTGQATRRALPGRQCRLMDVGMFTREENGATYRYARMQTESLGMPTAFGHCAHDKRVRRDRSAAGDLSCRKTAIDTVVGRETLSVPIVTRGQRPAQTSRGVNASSVVFGEGDDLYASMLADIDRARECIRLESYIFSNDEIGRRFSVALVKRASAGVEVRVHLDAAGTLFEGTDKIVDIFARGGVDSRWFNRWSWTDPWRYNRRNHRKLLVIDDRCVYVGGFNLHRESSLALMGCERWRDVHVRVSGPLAGQAAVLFDALWERRLEGPPAWVGPHRLVPNLTRACRRVLHCSYIDALSAAENTIDLCTPYFVPDRRFRAALVAAARRGVAVRILVPAQSDAPLVQWATHGLARPLARKGIAFFEYPPRMLHSKVTLIDSCWTMVGSANIDYRSFFINREINLISRESELCRQIGALLREDFAQARPLRWVSSRRNRLRSMAESLGNRMRRWL